MAGFEPAISSSPSWRIAMLSHILSEAVPAAGIEPAASAFSARRSHHLSYTGMNQRRRQESNLLDSRVAADRLAVRPRRHRVNRASGGTRTQARRLTVLGLSSITGLSEGGRWEPNPHNPGSQPGPAAALGSAAVSLAGVEPAPIPLGLLKIFGKRCIGAAFKD